MNFKNMDGNERWSVGNLARQSSVYSLTFDEFQNTLGGVGRDFGSMNMDQFLKNIETAEETQAMTSTFRSAERGPVSGNLLRQGSLTLPRTLSTKTVDEVWRDLFKETSGKDESNILGSCLPQRQQTLGEMTLEEFLVRAGVVMEGSQSTGRANNNDEFYGEVSHSNNVGLSLSFAQPAQSNGLVGNPIVNNCNSNNVTLIQNQSSKPMNINEVRSQHPLFQNQATVSYGTSMHGGESGNPGMRNGIVGMGDPTMSNGFGVGGDALQGGPRMGIVGLGAASITVKTGSPANQVSTDGIGKKDEDSSSLSPASYVFNGALGGRKRSGAVEKVVERRQRRMIKNRESAARSRARKQAYTMELEAEVAKLKEENQELQEKQAALVEMQKNQVAIIEMQKKQVLEMLSQQPRPKRLCLRRTQTGPW